MSVRPTAVSAVPPADHTRGVVWGVSQRRAITYAYYKVMDKFINNQVF